jgi:hypothetical protein
MDSNFKAINGSLAISIPLSGGEPLAGLSTGRGLANGHSQGVFGVFQLLIIGNVIIQHGLPDRDRRRQRLNARRVSRQSSDRSRGNPAASA